MELEDGRFMTLLELELLNMVDDKDPELLFIDDVTVPAPD